MAAVPPGPSGSSRAERGPFPGNGCSVSGERELSGRRLQDVEHAGHNPEACACEVERGGRREYSCSDLHPQCQTLERRINGLNCIGVAGLMQNHEGDESLDGLRTTVEHWDRSNCVLNTNGPEHMLGLPFQDTNSDTGVVALCRTEANQRHTSTGNDHGNKDTPGFLRTDEGPEMVTSQTGAADDGPVLEMCRLDLNRSLAAETGQEVQYVHYGSELQMPGIMRLITKDLSEPYSIYTYRYFIHNWPQLCFLAMVEEACVGAIVCKLDMHKKMFRRGYIAMLAVDSKHRRKNIGTNLVKKAIYAMVEGDCDEVVLETEITNKSALKLYENLGFVRDKRLFRYYLNGVDALRLKLWLR